MFSVLVGDCKWILFLHGWFGQICQIHPIGRKSLHCEKKLECVDLQRKNLRISKESLCGALGKVFKLVVGCRSEQIGLNSLRRALNADESPSSSWCLRKLRNYTLILCESSQLSWSSKDYTRIRVEANTKSWTLDWTIPIFILFPIY